MIACTSLLLLSLCTKAQAPTTEKHHTMKMNAGIITTKLGETLDCVNQPHCYGLIHLK